MVNFSVRVRGLDRMARKAKKRVGMVRDLDWLMGEINTHTGRRLDIMFANQGVVPGVYGEGSQKWVPNTEWTARAKGFNKALFSTPSHSGIRDKFKMRYRKGVGSRGGKMTIEMTNTHPAIKYLEAGYPRHAVTAGGWTGAGARALKIPWSPGVSIFRLYAFPGPMQARKIVGWIRGDLKWFLSFAAKQVLKAEEV